MDGGAAEPAAPPSSLPPFGLAAGFAAKFCSSISRKIPLIDIAARPAQFVVDALSAGSLDAP
jgi:hypothetical protein